ncbi:MAG: ABC transporter substrate-binding protein [Solobacterium sp.]|nr:ABC transporter substrate-binding protein [Solobacterium sp.]
MKKKIAIIAALISCTALSGCSRQTRPDNTDTAEETSVPETTVIRLAQPSNGHVLNIIAEKQGYLADEGITVEYVPVESDAEVFRKMKNGEIDVASNSGTNLPLKYISERMDLTIFAGYLITGCMPVFARAETEWNGIQDLVGKTMACELNMYAISGPLLDMGYNPAEDVTWLQYDDQEERIRAVENGEADFGLVGTSLNYEIISNPDIKILTYASDILPYYSCCRVEAMTSWIKKNPNTVKALLKAWIRAMAYYDAHHEETVKMMSNELGMDEEIIRAYMDNPRFELNTDPMKKSVERAWNYIKQLQPMDQDISRIRIDDHINVDIYKAALDECHRQYGAENQKFYERLQAQFSKNNR